jgi:hypothetical protein
MDVDYPPDSRPSLRKSLVSTTQSCSLIMMPPKDTQ